MGTVWPRPDGGKLAIRSDEANGTLHVVDLKTGNDSVLGDAGIGTSQIRWSPDSSTLAWTAGSKLYLMKEGAAKPTVVENGNAQYGQFAWSFDSRFVAYCHADREGDVEAWSCRIEVVEAASGKGRVIAGPLWTMSDPAWSPDSTRLVYAGNPRQEPATVEVYDLAQEKSIARLTPLRSKGPLQSMLRWMPDGKSVSYHQPTEGKADGKVIGEQATLFIDVASGTVGSVNRELPFFFAPLPGLDWLLALNHQDDIVLWGRDGSRTIYLTESPEDKCNSVFLPAPKK
jgi:Tol biopolymer transport system component